MIKEDVLLQLEIENIPGDPDDIDVRLVDLMIRKAERAILTRRYPFGYEDDQIVENRFYDIWIEASVYLYNRLGVEGQKYHKEAEVSRGYDEAYIPESLLRGITLKGGIPI